MCIYDPNIGEILKTKINFFQKARNFRSFIGYIGVTESENALSFAELALVFNKIFSLGPIFHGILVPRTKIFAENWS